MGLLRTVASSSFLAATLLGCAVAPRPMASAPPTTPRSTSLAEASPPHAEPIRTDATPPESTPRAEPKEPEPTVSPPAPAPPPRVRSFAIGKGTRVLMIGDSMVHSGLGFSLKRMVEGRGGTMTLATLRNATTVMYNHEPQLGELLESEDPDIVLIALGSNELFIPSPEMRVDDIKGIVSRIGDRPCVWVGPNPWAIEKGLLGVIKRSSSPCRYFDSSKLTFEHQEDGVHPTLRGGRTWANAVWKKYFEHPEREATK